MKTFIIPVIISLFLMQGVVKSQDTFSILAFDSITREVGAAGASCVDLFNFPQFTSHFICELFPDTGAIACQASYIVQNQVAARNRMRVGDSPSQLLSWMTTNDIQGNPSVRQYGVVRMGAGSPQTDAYTGTNCLNYKNHVIGPNYTIHGNILLGQMVLDSMEARFNRENGDLACKLMAAMQGAKMVGADTRCSGNGTSSLFAFLKVTQPTDTFDKPSLLLSLKTHANDQIEPIDSLQALFDMVKDCDALFVGTPNFSDQKYFRIFPNPANDAVIIRFDDNGLKKVYLTDICGNILGTFQAANNLVIELKDLTRGMYLLRVETSAGLNTKKLVVQ